MSDSKSAFASLLGPVSAVIDLYRGYKAAVKEAGDVESQAAELRTRLGAQLDQMAHLHDEQRKEAEETAKKAARAQEEAERAAEKAAKAEEERQRKLAHALEEQTRLRVHLAEALKTMAAAEQADQARAAEHEQFMLKMQLDDMMEFGRAVVASTADIRLLLPQIHEQTAAVKQASEAYRGMQEILHLNAQTGDVVGASMKAVAGATMEAGISAAIYGENAGKALLQTLKATLASISEESAVKAIFSLATYFIDMATYQEEQPRTH